MTQEDYIIKVIKPDNGFVLTQKEDVNILDRVFFYKELYLGANDSEANWKEITEAEAKQLEEEKKLAEEAQIAANEINLK